MNNSAQDKISIHKPVLNKPVTESQRIRSIDTLRGFALLGILLLNIIAFSGPLATYYDPSANNGISGLNLATAMLSIFGQRVHLGQYFLCYLVPGCSFPSKSLTLIERH